MARIGRLGDPTPQRIQTAVAVPRIPGAALPIVAGRGADKVVKAFIDSRNQRISLERLTEANKLLDNIQTRVDLDNETDPMELYAQAERDIDAHIDTATKGVIGPARNELRYALGVRALRAKDAIQTITRKRELDRSGAAYIATMRDLQDEAASLDPEESTTAREAIDALARQAAEGGIRSYTQARDDVLKTTQRAELNRIYSLIDLSATSDVANSAAYYGAAQQLLSESPVFNDAERVDLQPKLDRRFRNELAMQSAVITHHERVRAFDLAVNQRQIETETLRLLDLPGGRMAALAYVNSQRQVMGRDEHARWTTYLSTSSQPKESNHAVFTGLRKDALAGVPGTGVKIIRGLQNGMLRAEDARQLTNTFTLAAKENGPAPVYEQAQASIKRRLNIMPRGNPAFLRGLLGLTEDERFASSDYDSAVRQFDDWWIEFEQRNKRVPDRSEAFTELDRITQGVRRGTALLERLEPLGGLGTPTADVLRDPENGPQTVTAYYEELNALEMGVLQQMQDGAVDPQLGQKTLDRVNANRAILQYAWPGVRAQEQRMLLGATGEREEAK